MGKLQVVVGGQYGSEAKGAVAAWLAASAPDDQTVACMRVAGPNAGHTVIGEEGREWKLRSVPVAAVSNRNAVLLVGPGSEVEWDVTSSEIIALDDAGYGASARTWIDRSATVLTDEHKAREGEMVDRIGSTGKGIGAARSDRIMRDADLVGGLSDTSAMARGILGAGGTVVVEGTQGYGLGLHGDYYPQCTSSDCRAVDFLAMAGLSPWADYVTDFEVWVVFRTYPIRVAGNSGPMLREISWDRLGVAPERTTVTNKIRRVAEWDPDLARKALIANGDPSSHLRVALMFLDYVQPDIAGLTGETVWKNETTRAIVRNYEADLQHTIHAVSTAPGAITPWRGRA